MHVHKNIKCTQVQNFLLKKHSKPFINDIKKPALVHSTTSSRRSWAPAAPSIRLTYWDLHGWPECCNNQWSASHTLEPRTPQTLQGPGCAPGSCYWSQRRSQCSTPKEGEEEFELPAAGSSHRTNFSKENGTTLVNVLPQQSCEGEDRATQSFTEGGGLLFQSFVPW